jgi:hypothetical protein
MCLFSRLQWSFALGIILATGCADVAERPQTALLNLVIRSAELPLEGVQLCEANTDNCALTDANGSAAIALPINQEISYTMRKNGYDSILVPDIIPANGISTYWDLKGFQMELVADLYASVMSPYPRRGTGEIYIGQTPGAAREGVTYDLAGATGKRYYEEGDILEGDYSWRLDLTATTANGAGGFVEITPGRFRIQFGGATSGCLPVPLNGGGWPADIENSVWVPVMEDHVTFVQVVCGAPP